MYVVRDVTLKHAAYNGILKRETKRERTSIGQSFVAGAFARALPPLSAERARERAEALEIFPIAV